MLNLATKTDIQNLTDLTKRQHKQISEVLAAILAKIKEAPLTADEELDDGVIAMTSDHDEKAMDDLLGRKEKE